MAMVAARRAAIVGTIAATGDASIVAAGKVGVLRGALSSLLGLIGGMKGLGVLGVLGLSASTGGVNQHGEASDTRGGVLAQRLRAMVAKRGGGMDAEDKAYEEFYKTMWRPKMPKYVYDMNTPLGQGQDVSKRRTATMADYKKYLERQRADLVRLSGEGGEYLRKFVDAAKAGMVPGALAKSAKEQNPYGMDLSKLPKGGGGGGGGGGGRAAKEDPRKEQTEALLQSLVQLRREMALGDDATRKAAMAYDILNGEFAKADPKVKQLALQLAGKADAQEKARKSHQAYAESIREVWKDTQLARASDEVDRVNIERKAAGYASLTAQEEKNLRTAVAVRNAEAMARQAEEQRIATLRALGQQAMDYAATVREEILLTGALTEQEKMLRLTQEGRYRTIHPLAKALLVATAMQKDANDAAQKSATELADRRREIAADFQSEAAQLRERIALMNASTDAERAAYDMEHGKLSRLHPIAKAYLMVLNKIADAKAQEKEHAERVRGFYDEMADRVHRLTDSTREAQIAWQLWKDGFRDTEEIKRKVRELLQLEQMEAWKAKVEEVTRFVQDRLMQMFDTILNGGFRDFFSNILGGLRSLLSDMAREIVRSMAFDWLRGVFTFRNGGGGGSSMWGWLGGLLSGRRAAGGPVSRGNAYLVGERGPELFMPGSSGTIINNRDSIAALSGGGGGVTVSINVNTPDVQGFKRSESQIAEQMGIAISRALRRNGVRA
jgi:hypothetical protein